MPKILNYVNIDIIDYLCCFHVNLRKMDSSMEKQENKFVVRSKIWLEDNTGKVAFGLGRFRILEAIDRPWIHEFSSCGIIDELPCRLVQDKGIGRAHWQKTGGQERQGISLDPFCQGPDEAIYRPECQSSRKTLTGCSATCFKSCGAIMRIWLPISRQIIKRTQAGRWHHLNARAWVLWFKLYST